MASPLSPARSTQPASSKAAAPTHQADLGLPTVHQLLARSQGALQRPQSLDEPPAPAPGVVSWRKGEGFSPSELARLKDPAVRRKADVAQLYFYDHYFDLLTYLRARQERLHALHSELGVVEPSQSATAAHEERVARHRAHESSLLRSRRVRVQPEHFHIITQVGQGGYGEVFLARARHGIAGTKGGAVVALKRMRKRTLAKLDEVRHVLTERDILASTHSDWLVRLLYAFQDAEFVYLAMDFVPGGDFRTLLNNSGVLKEEHARFYMSEMVSAVAALHKLGYIHRDLKPENFLIDRTGHIKLTDFGLAAGALNPDKIEHMRSKLQHVKESEPVYRSTSEMKDIYRSIRMSEPRYADSVVGSPDYMAIEVLRGQPYSFSVDYWSLGCILFEFLAGFPPFSGACADETWTNLRHWASVLRRPRYDRPEDLVFNLSDDGWDAITQLIATKDQRLQSVDAVARHPFFRAVDWANLRQSKAPFVPTLDSDVDAGYFDDFASEADMAKYAEVREKQRNVEAVQDLAAADSKHARSVWVGFTFKARSQDDPVWQHGSPDLQSDSDQLETLF